jgi:hypothetical protein
MIMRSPLRLAGLGLVLLGAALGARADIYKYVDADGNVTFTDRYRPGAIKVMDDYQPARGHASAQPKRASSNPSPASFPKVTPLAQRQRDDLRRQILLEERGHESQSLATANAELAAGMRKPGTDLARLQDTARRHEKNIAMLDKELARLK